MSNEVDRIEELEQRVARLERQMTTIAHAAAPPVLPETDLDQRIRAGVRLGMTQQELADQYGVTVWRVRQAVIRRQPGVE